jgi:hypothetical protein
MLTHLHLPIRHHGRFVINIQVDQILSLIYRSIPAFLGYFDFIYCMPNAWLSVPFTFLGPWNDAYEAIVLMFLSLCRHCCRGRGKCELYQPQ